MFLETKTRIATRYGRTDSTTLARIGEFLNDICQEAYNYVGIMEEVSDYITTENGRMSYPLAPYIQPMRELMLIPTESRRIRYVSRETFEAVPDHTSSGPPSCYTIADVCGVMEQPSSQLSVVSTNNADKIQTITIHGISHYRYVTETISLNGTTPALSTYYYTYLTQKPVMNAVAAGTVTVKSNSNGVTCASIAIGSLTPTTYLDPADTITFDSSSASDTQKATIDGTIIDASNNFKGLPFKEEVALTGQSDKTTTNRFTTIREISLASVAVGTIRITSPSIEKNPHFIGIIPPGRTTLEYQIVAFDPIPDGQMGILYKGTRNPAKLVNDGDRPTLDVRTWPIIERWAENAFNDWKGDRRGVPHIIGQPAFKADMDFIKRLHQGKVQNIIRKGQNRFPLTTKTTHTFHLDPNTYGPPEY